jgi:guanylate kinase
MEGFETDGEDAHFMTVERLELDIENGKLFWWSEDSAGNLEGLVHYIYRTSLMC